MMSDLGRWYAATTVSHPHRRVFVRRFVTDKVSADAAGSKSCVMVECYDGGDSYPYVITIDAARVLFELCRNDDGTVEPLPSCHAKALELRRSHAISR